MFPTLPHIPNKPMPGENKRKTTGSQYGHCRGDRRTTSHDPVKKKGGRMGNATNNPQTDYIMDTTCQRPSQKERRPNRKHKKESANRLRSGYNMPINKTSTRCRNTPSNRKKSLESPTTTHPGRHYNNTKSRCPWANYHNFMLVFYYTLLIFSS